MTAVPPSAVAISNSWRQSIAENRLLRVTKQSIVDARRPQFSLAALLIGLSAFCLWLGGQWKRAESQRKALLVIEHLHGVASFEDRPRLNSSTAVPEATPSCVGRAAREPLSKEHFRSIAEINISFNPYVMGAEPERRANDDDLRVICAVRSIRRLSLNGTAVTEQGLAYLSLLPNLETLRLQNPITLNSLEAAILLRRCGHGYEDSTLVLLQGYEYGAAAVPFGDNFPHAMWVARDSMWRFAGPKVTDEGSWWLAGLRSLRELNLDGTEVTDAGVKWLGKLRNLERLSLAETAVSDAGLAILCRFPKLKTLDLTGARITNAGLANLRGANPGLTVRLGETGVTQEAVEKLTTACIAAKRSLPRVSLRIRHPPDAVARRARRKPQAPTTNLDQAPP